MSTLALTLPRESSSWAAPSQAFLGTLLLLCGPQDYCPWRQPLIHNTHVSWVSTLGPALGAQPVGKDSEKAPMLMLQPDRMGPGTGHPAEDLQT